MSQGSHHHQWERRRSTFHEAYPGALGLAFKQRCFLSWGTTATRRGAAGCGGSSSRAYDDSSCVMIHGYLDATIMRSNPLHPGSIGSEEMLSPRYPAIGFGHAPTTLECNLAANWWGWHIRSPAINFPNAMASKVAHALRKVRSLWSNTCMQSNSISYHMYACIMPYHVYL